MTSAAVPPVHLSLFGRVKRSITASAGDAIFGMEDGTVSIFGLVAGVAATTTSSEQVLLAGAAGAAAAAVLMGAGVFLDRDTEEAQRAAAMKLVQAQVQVDPSVVQRQMEERLVSVGMPAERAAVVVQSVGESPDEVAQLAHALQTTPPDGAGIGGHAIWMFVSNLFAGLVPVIPFAFLDVQTARWWAIGLTAILIVILGVGRSVAGHTKLVPSVLSTLAIAAVAAGAGVLISLWLSGEA